MKLDLKPGKYIVAVSGGVDSMVLLDLVAQKKVNIVVAHFDHGTRPDSADDAEFARHATANYGLPFELGSGALGAAASEATARRARYNFLNAVKAKYGADFIVTAHHQDDLIETAMLNLLRGSNRRGLSAIKDNPGVVRQLIDKTKAEILGYAKTKDLQWREDPTNSDKKYLRNYIRLYTLPNLSAVDRHKLLQNIQNVSVFNKQIDKALQALATEVAPDSAIDRYKFGQLPVDLSRELLAFWLRQRGLNQYDSKDLNRLNMVIRTARPGSVHNVFAGSSFKLDSEMAHLDKESV
jgi:tRNA(Ile)-lysidine synthase